MIRQNDKPLTMRWSVLRGAMGEPLSSLITGTALRLLCIEAPRRWWSVTLTVEGFVPDSSGAFVKRKYNHRPSDKLSLNDLMASVSAYVDTHVYDECADMDVSDILALAAATKTKPTSEYK